MNTQRWAWTIIILHDDQPNLILQNFCVRLWCRSNKCCFALLTAKLQLKALLCIKFFLAYLALDPFSFHSNSSSIPQLFLWPLLTEMLWQLRVLCDVVTTFISRGVVRCWSLFLPRWAALGALVWMLGGGNPTVVGCKSTQPSFPSGELGI